MKHDKLYALKISTEGVLSVLPWPEEEDRELRFLQDEVGGLFLQHIRYLCLEGTKNMQLLEKYRHDFAHLSLEDGANYARMLPEGKENVSTLEPRDGWYFSIFSLSKQCRGVTIKNAAYELEDYTLTRQFPLGVSNEFTKENAAISYDSGALLFVMSRK